MGIELIKVNNDLYKIKFNKSLGAVDVSVKNDTESVIRRKVFTQIEKEVSLNLSKIAKGSPLTIEVVNSKGESLFKDVITK